MIYDNDEFWEWVYHNINDDVLSLRLRNHGKDEWIDAAITQIECRRRCNRKLTDTLKCRHFVFPSTLSAEQCTSEILADFHAGLVDDCANVLDMTCGLGIDTFHIARKASSVTAVELNSDTAEAAAHNAKALSLSNVTILHGDSTSYLKECDKRFDTIFIDPARRGDAGQRLFALSDCRPDVTALLPDISAHCRKLIVKASPMLDVTHTLRELPMTRDIYIVGNTRECKELVSVVDFTNETNDVTIHAWTSGDDFSYTLSQESEAAVEFGVPEDGWYLYEPYPAIMKCAPYKLLSSRFGVKKLHPNTHLYTSSSPVDMFPGERWKIERVIPFASSELKRFSRKYPQINVAVRNFGWSADKLKAKLKVKDGGDKRLIGATITGDIKIMLVLCKDEH